ncbi:MAG: hypothetical protein H0T68_12140 [Gemmatimonadales bacterium]|nr:hypothetical protein [Gemmatimonadales bacterium]
MSTADAKDAHRHAFELKLIGEPQGEGDRLFIWGRMTFGHFHDDFQAPLYDWAPGDYTAQWLEAATRLVEGAPVAVFLTHMVHPSAAYHLGWPAWREGDQVFLQERLFLTEQLTAPFDPQQPEAHAGPRRELTPDGERIAQWRVKLGDVADFLRRRSAGQSG